MSISEHTALTGPSGAGPGGVLAEGRAQVTKLTETLWAARSDGEVVEMVEQVLGLKATLAALDAGLIAEAETRQVAKKVLHYGSPTAWQTNSGGLRLGHGRRLVARAVALTGSLADTRAAM